MSLALDLSLTPLLAHEPSMRFADLIRRDRDETFPWTTPPSPQPSKQEIAIDPPIDPCESSSSVDPKLSNGSGGSEKVGHACVSGTATLLTASSRDREWLNSGTTSSGARMPRRSGPARRGVSELVGLSDYTTHASRGREEGEGE
jgi:hypothetical protein